MFSKRTWAALAILLVALVAATAYAAANLNRYLNDNREWIAARVESTLGREISFDSVGLSLRGGLGVRIDNLEIADDPSFSQLPFLTSAAIVVRVKLLPALLGRIEVARIVLDAPSVQIIRDAERLNTASLAGGEADDGTAPADSSQPAAGILIALLEVDDGRVRYVDQTVQPPAEVVVTRIDFTASDVSALQPVRFSLRASALGAIEQNVTVEGTVGPIDAAHIERTPVEVDTALSPIELDTLRRLPAMAASIPQDLTIDGPLGLEASLRGSVSEASVHVKLDATESHVGLPSSFEKRRGVPLTVQIDATRTSERIDVRSAVLMLRDAELTGTGTVTPGEPLRYDLSVTSNRIGLEDWEQILPPLAGIKIGGNANVALQISSEASGNTSPQLGGTIKLNDLSLRGEALPAISRLSSELSLGNGKLRMPPSDFDLGGSRARIEATVATSTPLQGSLRLTAPALDGKSLGLADAVPSTPDRFEQLVLAVDLSTSQAKSKIVGDLETPRGTLAGTAYRNLSARFRLESGRAVLNPLSLDVFDGRLKGEGVYDFSKADKPTFNFEVQADQVEIGKLLTCGLVGADRFLHGKLNGKISLAGNGSNWQTIRDGLVGGGRIDLSDGALEDVNVAEEVLHSLTGIPGLNALLSPELRRQYPQLFSTGQTAFERLSGVISVARGRIASEDISIKAPDFLLFGYGSVGLDQSVDIKATFEASQALSQSLSKQVAAARYLANQAGRVQIPFRLNGTLSTVKAEPDTRFVQSALEKAVAGSLSDALLKSRPKAKDSQGEQGTQAPTPAPLEDVIRKGIGGLLGQ